MDVADIAFVKAMVMATFVAGTALTAYWLRLRSRMLRSPDLERQMEAVREEARLERETLESRLAELEERVDFTERRLAEAPRQAARLEPPVVTPI